MTSEDRTRLSELHRRTMPIAPLATFATAVMRAGMAVVEADHKVLFDVGVSGVSPEGVGVSGVSPEDSAVRAGRGGTRVSGVSPEAPKKRAKP